MGNIAQACPVWRYRSPLEDVFTSIVEATGWVIDAKGEAKLTANAPATTLHGSWHNSVSCRAS
ncbi:hypothetical protein LC608_30725 [Nostoc sp. XA010]|uniref:hypothetical protein n=1 Tax=Nostoc sp. XA010 TaxID=2780407 RepID=UPI001E493970|nr:hypothetical protein [Nostoc sp. XA010]MCC5661257.1 hypothetical protein [Nostoc sp. XA010]